MTRSHRMKERLDEYLNELAKTLNHKDRHKPLADYISGLMISGNRKSIEPMAARLEPEHTQALHQSMHHFVANAEWDDHAILQVTRNRVLKVMKRHGGVEAWIVDDTGMPKKGNHSVGVVRQYCGNLGKKENCQVSVSVSIANEALSLPVSYRLYLPEIWANDSIRLSAAGVPRTVHFQTKWKIALDELAKLLRENVPRAPVLADAGYGNVTAFRDELSGMKIPYVVGINPETTVWPPDMQPLPPKKYSGQGRPPTRLRRTEHNRPITSMTLAMNLPMIAWYNVAWREGTKGKMQSRFAAIRVRPSHDDRNRKSAREEEWLLIEWPNDEPAPVKFWLSTLEPTTTLEDLVKLAKLRWRIERDYEELKNEIGLDHYEGRGWRGFHHHATLCIATYGFLVSEKASFSPLGPLAIIKASPLPKDFKVRGSPDST